MLCLAPSATVKIFEHLVDVLVNTSMPSHWLNSVAWPVCRVPKFRNNPDWKQQYPHDNSPFTSPCAYLCQRRKFHHHPSLFDIRDFKNQRLDDNEKVKKSKRFNKQNNNFAQAPHFFVHFLPVFARLRRENALFRVYGGRKQATTKFYFSFWAWIWSLEIQLFKGGFAYIWQSKWVGIMAIKTDRMQIHFLSDVFVVFASLNLKVPVIKLQSFA